MLLNCFLMRSIILFSLFSVKFKSKILKLNFSFSVISVINFLKGWIYSNSLPNNQLFKRLDIYFKGFETIMPVSKKVFTII